MKDGPTGKASNSEFGTDWNQLRAMSDVQAHAAVLEDPDARATDEEFWKDAQVVLPVHKAVVTMRLDSDLLEWFRQQRGYQTRINAILRAYMKSRQQDENPLRWQPKQK